MFLSSKKLIFCDIFIDINYIGTQYESVAYSNGQ